MIEYLAQVEAPAVPPMNPLLTGLLVLVGLGSLACWIIEIVNAFKKEQSPLLGILSIVLCGLGGFIIGWVKSKAWGIQKVMTIWTVLIIVQLIIQMVAMKSMMPVAPAP